MGLLFRVRYQKSLAKVSWRWFCSPLVAFLRGPKLVQTSEHWTWNWPPLIAQQNQILTIYVYIYVYINSRLPQLFFISVLILLREEDNGCSRTSQRTTSVDTKQCSVWMWGPQQLECCSDLIFFFSGKLVCKRSFSVWPKHYPCSVRK